MNKERRTQVKVGAFVLLGMAIFIVIVYLIGSKSNMFGGTINIVGKFQNVGGLQVGHNVRFAGITVGTVNSITILNDTSVEVGLSIDKKVQKYIRKNSKATIGSDGLMGNKLVNITNGTADSPIVKDGDMIMTIKPVDLEDVMASVNQVAINAAVLTDNLAQISDKINRGEGAIGALLTDKTVINNVNKTLVTVEEAAHSFDRNMDALSKTFLFRKQEEDKKRK
jgi:phospholipid/cholesterol/gamma-HCH transport system substrate-binding protein